MYFQLLNNFFVLFPVNLPSHLENLFSSKDCPNYSAKLRLNIRQHMNPYVCSRDIYRP